MITPDLSVVINSSRPKWLVNTLHQLQTQIVPYFTLEILVVIEASDPERFKPITTQYSQYQYLQQEINGHCGAAAKDLGIQAATGELICFWDDDNIYYPHALVSLYETTRTVDLGIVSVLHMGQHFRAIPSQPKISQYDIDTMCLGVRTNLAKSEPWFGPEEKCTDYFWLQKLLPHDPVIKFSDVVIGVHLDE